MCLYGKFPSNEVGDPPHVFQNEVGARDGKCLP